MIHRQVVTLCRPGEDHAWGHWETVTAPAGRPTSYGTIKRTCIKCGQLQWKSLMLSEWATFLKASKAAQEPTVLAPGEVSEMKDPVILCPKCKGPATRLRKLSGYRCSNKQCLNYEVLCATDMQVISLKIHLKKTEDEELVAWARSFNSKDRSL
jgi:hypothetical protein